MSHHNIDKCKICQNEIKPVFKAKIMDKYLVEYFQCVHCEFLQTEKTYWLEEAYQSSMNLTDTGIMLRNGRSSKIVTAIICLFFKKDQKFLDYAGGYGVFTRIMRDIGFDFYSIDPYTPNVLSRGFDMKESDAYDLVTTFESFEHFDQPLEEIEKIFKISKNVIFSTELAPKPLPKPQEWWYYGLEHGQHVAFHSKKSLELIAKNNNTNYYNIGNLHLFSERKINALGTLFLKFKFSKYILYISYYFFAPFLKSKTVSDMYNLRKGS